MANETLSFSMTGEGWTNLIRDFIAEGSINTAFEIMKDVPEEVWFQLFFQQYKAIGDTRDNSMQLVKTEKEEWLTQEEVVWVLKNIVAKSDYKIWELTDLTTATELQQSILEKRREEIVEDTLSESEREEAYEDLEDAEERFNEKSERVQKNFLALQLIFLAGKLDLINYLQTTLALPLQKAFLTDKGFCVNYREDLTPNLIMDGIILESGLYISVGHQDHNYAYHKLSEMDLSGSWMSCMRTIRISSNQMPYSGLGKTILKSYRTTHEAYLTEEQIKTLIVVAPHLGSYGGDDNIPHYVMKYYRDVFIKKGGKYGSLLFLKEAFPEVLIPEISLEKPQGKYCVRSSPRKSMAGILDSYFHDDVLGAEDKMQKKFQEHKDLIPHNALHYFYQEHLDGDNGVCHFDFEGFRCAVSRERGAIVAGKKGDIEVRDIYQEQLKTIAEKIYNYFSFREYVTIQLEFVITSKGLYIVQLRVIEAEISIEKPKYADDKKLLATGRTFYMYYNSKITLKTSEILIITSDVPSHTLIGKKALIVVNQDEFSHTLALSVALKIPSIQVDKLPNLPEVITLDVGQRTGYILSQ